MVSSVRQLPPVNKNLKEHWKIGKKKGIQSVQMLAEMCFNLFFPFGKSEGFHKSKVLHKSYLLLYLALSSSFDCHDGTTWSDTNFLSWILIMISSRGNFYFGYYEPVFSMKIPSWNHLIKNKSVFGLEKPNQSESNNSRSWPTAQ